MNFGSPNHLIYPARKTILTILQNVKGRELQKSQPLNCLVSWGKMDVQSKLILKKPVFNLFHELEKNNVQLEHHSKINLLVYLENLGVHLKTKIQKCQFAIYK